MRKILSNNSNQFLSLIYNLDNFRDLTIKIGNKMIDVACISFVENNLIYILEIHNPYGLHPIRSGYMEQVVTKLNMDIKSSKLATIVETVLKSCTLYSVSSSLSNNDLCELELLPEEVSDILSECNKDRSGSVFQTLIDQGILIKADQRFHTL